MKSSNVNCWLHGSTHAQLMHKMMHRQKTACLHMKPVIHDQRKYNGATETVLHSIACHTGTVKEGQ